jgi:hypothetical protein
MGDEKIIEQITDAMTGYFDFGDGMQDAEWEASYHVAQHIARKLPGSLVIGPEDIAALRRVVMGVRFQTEWLYPEQNSDIDRLAALIGDDGNG